VPVRDPRQPQAAPASGSRSRASVQSLVPVGRAPGPAGEGKSPPKLLNICLPKEYTAALASDHYTDIRARLFNHARQGAHNILTVLVNVRLTKQMPGRVKPTVLMVSICSIVLL
jgi:hypothetical protein